MSIKDKMIALIPKKQSVEQVKVPDLKQYLVDGYNEIRKVKSEKIELENKLEEQKQIEQLYEGVLVTLDEFKKRDEENGQEIERLKEKINKKDNEIYLLKDTINNYKIQEKKLEEKQKELKRIENGIYEEIESEVKEKIANYKKGLSYKIKNTKGNLSKEKIIEIIES